MTPSTHPLALIAASLLFLAACGDATYASMSSDVSTENNNENQDGDNSGDNSGNNGLNNLSPSCEALSDLYQEGYVEAVSCEVEADCVLREAFQCGCGDAALNREADVETLADLSQEVAVACGQLAPIVCFCAPSGGTQCSGGVCQATYNPTCDAPWTQWSEAQDRLRRCTDDEACQVIPNPVCGTRDGCYLAMGRDADPTESVDALNTLASTGCLTDGLCECPDSPPSARCVRGRCRIQP